MFMCTYRWYPTQLHQSLKGQRKRSWGGNGRRRVRAATLRLIFSARRECKRLLFQERRRGGAGSDGLTSAIGTPSGGRQCRTIIPLIGTSFPWGSCSKFFLRSVWGDKRQLSGVKCYGQPGLNPIRQLTRRPAPGSARHDLQNPLQPLDDSEDPTALCWVICWQGGLEDTLDEVHEDCSCWALMCIQ